MKNLKQKILSDIRVELTEAFKENFRRKGFFDQKWPARRGGGHSRLLLKSGNLLRSIKATVKSDSVVFTSSLPYASIHNEGGEIMVTERMKRFFWAKHLEVRKACKILSLVDFARSHPHAAPRMEHRKLC